MSSESVKVAVRVRPFNGREKDRNATCIIRMPSQVKTIIINPDTQEEKEFAFDYSYWSHDGFDVLEDPDGEYPGGGYNAPANRKGGPTSSAFGCEYASQLQVYQALGRGVLNNALAGFNCCLFAYGQTGSGKSYSFVGYGSNKGIVPQVCDEVFKKKTELAAAGTELQVTFSMMEIYNEKIRDLLNPDPKTNNDLKVRTTPKGTYVEGVKSRAVGSFDTINAAMEAGTASRTVAATQMNATSSRAHTVMTISVKQHKTEDGIKKEVGSDMNLVDLAGSERAESTGATGDRLKEGAAINKSLSSLGNVISALAEQSNNPKKKVFIPYRDSKLTQILQSALGGNSKTIMVAALSPADINFEETLSTLRYADRAKQIKVVVEVMENPTDRLIRQLKEENDKLKKMMEAMGGDGFDPAAFAAMSGGGGAEAKGTITEDEMQAAIEKAVAEVKAASAQEKQAAIEAVRAEMMARHESLMHGMISRANFEHTLGDIINGTSADSAAKESATAKLMAAIDRDSKQRTQSGGKLDSDDAVRAMEAGLESVEGKATEGELAAAKAKTAELLSPGTPVWADGLLDEAEYEAVSEKVLALMPSLSPELRKAAREHMKFTFRTEQEAAQSDMHSKVELLRLAAQVVKELGGDTASAVATAEMRFDQLLRDAEEGTVDEGVMQATLAKAMGHMTGSADEKREMMSQAKRSAGWGTSKDVSSAADAQQRAKMQIAQALAKNAAMMSDLSFLAGTRTLVFRLSLSLLFYVLPSLFSRSPSPSSPSCYPPERIRVRVPVRKAMSFDQKLSITEQEAQEQQSLLKALGLGGLSAEEMKVTPSLRNLNQDPTMADALVYYLTKGTSLITTPEDADAAGGGGPVIVLNGGGMMPKHCTIVFSANGAESVRFCKGAGTSFLNGKPIEQDEVVLKHNDRLILGNSQAFRVVNPLDPQAASQKSTQLIDWDLAQTELAEAMGTAVDLKVEEEMAKKKAALDAQLKAMEAKENEMLKAQLAQADPTAAQAAQLRQMDTRKRAIETYKARVKIHLSEYKRELMRLEESLRKVLPAVKEGNQMAQQLGRIVRFESTLITNIPQAMAFSPVEELLTSKVTELMVRVVIHNPRSDQSRDWFWSPEVFFDRMGHMRVAWQDCTPPGLEPQGLGSLRRYHVGMLKSVPIAIHTNTDPFFSKPDKQLIGSAYLYLAPVVFGVATCEWLPIVNYRGEQQGELRVHLTPTTKPTADPDTHKGKPINFTLRLEAVRGLMNCPNKDVSVEYTFANEEYPRRTSTSGGKWFDHVLSGGEAQLSLPPLDETLVAYLCKDAILFKVLGESDDVNEEGAAEAVEMEVPPETFNLFTAHDLVAADSGQLCTIEDKVGGKPKAGLVVAQQTQHKLTLHLAQENRHFRVCRVGNVSVGNAREAATGKGVGGQWTTLKVGSQKRGTSGDAPPWVVEVDLPELPCGLDSLADAAGKGFEVDCNFQVVEVEQVGELEDPIDVKHTLILQVVAPGAGRTEPWSEEAQKSSSRITSTTAELFLGQFEVTDAAVNEQMMALRSTSAEENTGGAKEILEMLDKQVEKRKAGLIAEVSRQHEALTVKALPLGLDLAPTLALWQLPPELLGVAEGGDDVASLKAQVADLKAQLAAMTKEAQQAQQQVADLKTQLAKRDSSQESAGSRPGQGTSLPPPPVAADKAAAEPGKPAAPGQPPAPQKEQAKSSACAVM